MRLRSVAKAQNIRMRLLRRDRKQSALPDHVQFLAQFDPAAVWQDAAEIYAGINHAIPSDN